MQYSSLTYAQEWVTEESMLCNKDWTEIDEDDTKPGRGFLHLTLSQPLPQPVLLAVEPLLQCFFPITS